MAAWHWFALAAALFVADLVIADLVVPWLAFGALFAAVVTLIHPEIPLPWALGAFGAGSCLGLAGVLAWRRVRPRSSGAETGLNRRGERLIGQIVILEQAIEGGGGRARVGDGVWAARGEDAPAGARMRIVAVEGAHLRVERVDGEENTQS